MLQEEIDMVDKELDLLLCLQAMLDELDVQVLLLLLSSSCSFRQSFGRRRSRCCWW